MTRHEVGETKPDDYQRAYENHLAKQPIGLGGQHSLGGALGGAIQGSLGGGFGNRLPCPQCGYCPTCGRSNHR